jgi:hypothetical protein
MIINKTAEVKKIILPVERKISEQKDKVEISGEKSTSPASKDKKPEGPDFKSISTGYALFLGYELSGIETYIHESAHELMVKNLYKNPQTSIQIDGIDNIKNFVKDPSLNNFKKVVTMYDANQDKAAGVTKFSYGEGPSELGGHFSQNGRTALTAAAGSLSTEIPAIFGFIAGFKMRKEHPFIGYSLMTATGLQHVSNSYYPISAVISGPKRPGHDWANFAKATGIHPAVTASVFALSLPAIAGGMYMWEKHSKEKEKDHQALAGLIAKGKIPKEELTEYFESYPKKEEIEVLENKLNDLFKRKIGDADDGFKKEFKKVKEELAGKYYKYSEYLIEKFPHEIEEEKKNLPADKKFSIEDVINDIKTSYKKDKLGTVLAGTGITGGIAFGLKASFDIIKAMGAGPVATAVAETAGNAIGAVIPALGIAAAAGAAYEAIKTIKNPEASKIDKITAAGIATFSGIAAAASLIPPFQLPLMIVGIAGMGGTILGRWIASKCDA